MPLLYKPHAPSPSLTSRPTQAERIVRLQRLAADEVLGKGHQPEKHVHWYIMTSPATHAATLDALEESGYFGLEREQVGKRTA